MYVGNKFVTTFEISNYRGRSIIERRLYLNFYTKESIVNVYYTFVRISDCKTYEHIRVLSCLCMVCAWRRQV